MKPLLIGIACLSFCQISFSASISAESARSKATCEIGEPTITKVERDGELIYTFTHPISFNIVGIDPGFFPICNVWISQNTKTTNLMAGWKFSDLPSMTDVWSNAGADKRGGICGRNGSFITRERRGRWFSQGTPLPSECTIQYSITLIKDSPNSAGGDDLCPLIGIEITSHPNPALSADTKIRCAPACKVVVKSVVDRK